MHLHYNYLRENTEQYISECLKLSQVFVVGWSRGQRFLSRNVLCPGVGSLRASVVFLLHSGKDIMKKKKKASKHLQQILQRHQRISSARGYVIFHIHINIFLTLKMRVVHFLKETCLYMTNIFVNNISYCNFSSFKRHFQYIILFFHLRQHTKLNLFVEGVCFNRHLTFSHIKRFFHSNQVMFNNIANKKSFFFVSILGTLVYLEHSYILLDG